MVEISKVKLSDAQGKQHDIPIIADKYISGKDLKKAGLTVLDPGYTNTAVTRSSVSYIDGERGILEYRGYKIEELAEKSTFLEVAHLLIYGHLPTVTEYAVWRDRVMKHTFVHNRMSHLMSSFNYDAHPMGMFISSMAAMSTFHAEANPALRGADLYVGQHGEAVMNKQIVRILGKAPTVAAAAYRHRIGRPTNLPRNDFDYCQNFLYMLDSLGEGSQYRPHPVLCRALDVMFILHAEHEMNCSTAAMLHIGSSRVDPYSAVAGAAAALYGPLHGGANEAVLRMLDDIHTVDQVDDFVEQVKRKKRRLMGFGHRVYKRYDPRAKIIQRLAHQVFAVCGDEPLIKVAMALEEKALTDDYFVNRKLYPNVDFYSGLIYKAMGFPTDYFPLLFALPRIAGWLAHWREQLRSPDQKIWRPLQVYDGLSGRAYVKIEDRPADDNGGGVVLPQGHPFNRRYLLSSKL